MDLVLIRLARYIEGKKTVKAKKTDKIPMIEIRRDLIDVASNHRPDLSWKFKDALGHLHRWYNGETLAIRYSASNTYHVPSVEWIVTGTAYYPDGTPYEIGYHQCRTCKEKIHPGYTSDRTSQYIAGESRFFVDGREVSKEELNEIMKLYGKDTDS